MKCPVCKKERDLFRIKIEFPDGTVHPIYGAILNIYICIECAVELYKTLIVYRE